jgi:DNA-binding CsgD family transcriptional regulator
VDGDVASQDAVMAEAHRLPGKPAPALEQARQAYASRAWREAHAQYVVVDSHSPLAPDDVERYARSALLTGNDEEYVTLLARASQLWIDQSNPARAAECACYLAMNLSFRGEWATAAGWQNRAQQFVAAVDGECPAAGWLLGMNAIQLLMSGNPAAARDRFEQALAIGRRCADPDLTAMTSMGIGQALVTMGEVAEGLGRHDEVMVSVVADELNPIVTGIIYCAVVEACQQGYDARRAAEWTRALGRWCDAQPDLVPFRGQCLVHRAQIMQLQGQWPDAVAQIGRAVAQLSRPPVNPAVGAAHFERAELHRLRGEFAQAEQAYELAGRFGHETQPGRALLRLAQGQFEQARIGITRALSETAGLLRPKLLAAAVDVALRTDDFATAQAYAAELAQIAEQRDAVQLAAMSAQASGSVVLASGQPARALPLLRRAWQAWQELEAPYFAACVRVRIGQACRQLGDLDASRTELAAAWSTFERLGARPDLQQLRTAGFDGAGGARTPGRLTVREVEVLRQVASGKTNRAIAAELVLSEKTVARHVSNVFGKLGVSSRAAATAYAYEHELV